MTSSESQPRTAAGRILLQEHSSGTPHMARHILAIEAEAAAGPPASAERVTRERLLAAIGGWLERTPDQGAIAGIHVDEAQDIPLFLDAILATLPSEAAVQEPEWSYSDFTARIRELVDENGKLEDALSCHDPECPLFAQGVLGHPLSAHLSWLKAAQPPPASVPTGYWEASGNLTPEMAKTIRPILEQAARDGKQLVVHEGITLRWVKAASVEAEGLDVEAVRLLRDIVETFRWDVDGHRVKYPIIPAGGGKRNQAALEAAREYLRLLEQREA